MTPTSQEQPTATTPQPTLPPVDEVNTATPEPPVSNSSRMLGHAVCHGYPGEILNAIPLNVREGGILGLANFVNRPDNPAGDLLFSFVVNEAVDNALATQGTREAYPRFLIDRIGFAINQLKSLRRHLVRCFNITSELDPEDVRWIRMIMRTGAGYREALVAIPEDWPNDTIPIRVQRMYNTWRNGLGSARYQSDEPFFAWLHANHDIRHVTTERSITITEPPRS